MKSNFVERTNNSGLEFMCDVEDCQAVIEEGETYYEDEEDGTVICSECYETMLSIEE